MAEEVLAIAQEGCLIEERHGEKAHRPRGQGELVEELALKAAIASAVVARSVHEEEPGGAGSEEAVQPDNQQRALESAS